MKRRKKKVTPKKKAFPKPKCLVEGKYILVREDNKEALNCIIQADLISGWWTEKAPTHITLFNSKNEAEYAALFFNSTTDFKFIVKPAKFCLATEYGFSGNSFEVLIRVCWKSDKSVCQTFASAVKAHHKYMRMILALSQKEYLKQKRLLNKFKKKFGVK